MEQEESGLVWEKNFQEKQLRRERLLMSVGRISYVTDMPRVKEEVEAERGRTGS